MKQFLKKLPKDKIKINWNKNPIRMDIFLSFLTIDPTRSSKHLGACNGWTRLFGDDNLDINGGEVGGIEYLDSLKYKSNLDNPYNDYVNPFYLFDIMTNEGKQFFLDYYSDEIQEQLKSASDNLIRATESKTNLFDFWQDFGVELAQEA